MEFADLEILLMDDQVDKRLDAIRQLSLMETFRQDLFLLALGDKDWRVRKEAISLFLRQPDAGLRAAVIIEQLQHPDNAGLRNAAIEILISLGAQGLPQLISKLETSDPEIRKFIVDILGEIGRPACVSALLPYLNDKDENVRYAVVETFGKLSAESAVNDLLDLLETSETGLRFMIFESLASIGSGVPVERILPYCEDRLLRKAVFTCLGRLGDVLAIPTLVNGLSDPLRKTREVALLSLGQLISRQEKCLECPTLANQADAFQEHLLPYLHHADLKYRRAAAFSLSLTPNLSTLEHILPLLADEEIRGDIISACRCFPVDLFAQLLESVTVENDLAIYLIFICGELKCGTVEPLAMQGLSSDNPQLRYASVMTLGKVEATNAIVALGDALADDSSDICHAASEALRQLGVRNIQAVITTIAPFLESDDASLRLLAVRTLGGLPLEEVEDYLLQALKDVDPDVRCEALRSLKGGSSQRLLSGLTIALTDESPAVRRLAAAALESFPTDKVMSIIDHVLDDHDPWVRATAINTLQVGDEQGLLSLLAKGVNDSVGVVQIAALETLARLFPDQSQQYLLTALVDEDIDVVRTAVSLLLKAGQVELLIKHESSKVRVATISALRLQGAANWKQLIELQLADENDPSVRQAIDKVLKQGTAGA